jgi:hypothetical protein
MAKSIQFAVVRPLHNRAFLAIMHLIEDRIGAPFSDIVVEAAAPAPPPPEQMSLGGVDELVDVARMA